MRIAILLILLCAVAIAAQQQAFDPWITTFAQTKQPAAIVPAAESDLRVKIESEARQPIDPSPWVQAEKQRYSSVLAQAKPEIVVLPFQIDETKDQFGIDLPARMIMAYMIAQRVGLTTQAKVADVELVSRALGQPRYLSRDHALAFAKTIGAATVYYGQTWHDGAGKLSVRLAKISVSAGKDESQAVNEAIPISDTVTPELAFRSIADTFIQQAGISSTIKREVYSIKPAFFPDNPVVATSVEPSNPVEGIWIQELLASLNPPQVYRGKERLFERAFAALDLVSPDSPDYRLLNARALVHLQRRPAALEAIGTPKTPEERAFVEYLNGNVPEMTAAISQITRPLPRLLAEMELLLLHRAYLESDEVIPSAIDYAKKIPTAWQPAIFWNASLQDEWSMRGNIEMKKVMDAHFPLPGQSAEELLKAKTVAGAPDNPRIAIEVEGLPISHSNEVLAQKGSLWCCASQSWQPRPFQYLDLLSNLSQAMLLHTVSHWHTVQGRAEQSLQMVDLLNEVIFKEGNTSLQYRKMLILSELLRSERDVARNKILATRLYETAKQVREWETGDSGIVVDAVNAERRAVFVRFSSKAEELAYPDLNAFKRDFPPTHNFLRTSEPYKTAISSAKNVDIIERTCGYSVVGMRACFAWRSALAATGRAAEADKYEKEQLMTRFHGNPYAEGALLTLMIDRGDIDAARAYSESIRAKAPKSSGGYFQLGGIAARTGDYADAQKYFLSYPLFSEPGQTNTVSISNKASWAAERLAIRGAAREARPLYEIAAKFQNGSGASYGAAIKLAYMDRRFGDARQIALKSVQHYGESGHTFDYLALLFATGNSAEGWAAAKEASTRFSLSDFWWATRVGFRIDNASEAAISAWIKDAGQIPARQGSTQNDNALTALTIGASVLSMDRDPQTIKTIANLRSNAFPNYKPQDLTSPDAAKRNTGIGEHLDYIERFVSGYLAFKEGSYETTCNVFRNWPVAGRTVASAEVFAGVLPYYAYAAVKSGQLSRFKAYLEEYRKPLRYTPLDQNPPPQYSRYDVYLAEAILYFAESNHLEAKRRLRQAKALGQPNGLRPLPPEYVLAEISEMLAADSGMKDYLDTALDWAKSTQLDKPWEAWAYAFEAKHGNNDDERAKAYAMARYLHKNSKRLAGIEPKIVKKADDWLQRNKPFPLDNIAKSKT